MHLSEGAACLFFCPDQAYLCGTANRKTCVLSDCKDTVLAAETFKCVCFTRRKQLKEPGALLPYRSAPVCCPLVGPAPAGPARWALLPSTLFPS